MKYFGLVWRNVWRKKIRTSLTILSVFVAFLLFALLSALGFAFKGGEESADAERLIVIDKVSLINLLPIAYKNQIAGIDGVHSVTHATWFGGYYQDPKNQFGQFPVDPHEYVAMYPEFKMPQEQFDAWVKNRTGAVVGKDIADAFGWKVGDRIPIQSTIWTSKSGEKTWEFDIEGIFTNQEPRGNTSMLLFHYDYFEEARAFGQGLVGWYIVRVNSGADPVQVQNAIDAEFENSRNQTESAPEAQFAAAFAKQYGNIALIVSLVLGAVFFTLLLVSGNTMSQSVRERISELAVLKTLGFSDRSVLGIVLSESILIMCMGGLLGIGIGAIAVRGVAASAGAILPGFHFSPTAMVASLGLMVGAGVVAGIFPALSAMRLSIVDALARA